MKRRYRTVPNKKQRNFIVDRTFHMDKEQLEAAKFVNSMVRQRNEEIIKKEIEGQYPI